MPTQSPYIHNPKIKNLNRKKNFYIKHQRNNVIFSLHLRPHEIFMYDSTLVY